MPREELGDELSHEEAFGRFLEGYGEVKSQEEHEDVKQRFEEIWNDE